MSQNRQRPILVPIPRPAPLVARAEDYEHGTRIPRHSHDSAQLIHASSGVMSVETDDGWWVVPPERAVWVPAHVGHSIRMTGRVELRSLYLDPAVAPIAGTRCCVVQISPVLRAAILRAVSFEQPYPECGREARLAAVMLDEIQAAPAAPLHLPMPSDPRAKRLADEVQANLSIDRTLGEWAKRIGASERTLERLFRNEVGVTFGTWRRQARLLRALEHLAAGASVTTTAIEVGFETTSAFIAMFRRSMGTTPAKYMRNPANSAAFASRIGAVGT